MNGCHAGANEKNQTGSLLLRYSQAEETASTKARKWERTFEEKRGTINSSNPKWEAEEGIEYSRGLMKGFQ